MNHFVSKKPLFNDYPSDSEEIIFGAGCFWGVERLFWQLDGVWTTYASYSGGKKLNPTYEQVCTGLTGHTETVNVIFEPKLINIKELMKVFWECHDPTQGNRQGNDIGSQYRSAIYCKSIEQHEIAIEMKKEFEQALSRAGYNKITTEIKLNQLNYAAESYHQQYLAKNPNGYCGLKGTGAICKILP